MIEYRIKQVEENKFIITQRDAPGKHFKQKYYNRGDVYTSEAAAQESIDMSKKFAAMDEDEFFAYAAVIIG